MKIPQEYELMAKWINKSPKRQNRLKVLINGIEKGIWTLREDGKLIINGKWLFNMKTQHGISIPNIERVFKSFLKNI